MRVHHTTVHNERLPNSTCKTCDEPFYAPYADRVNCDDCTQLTGTASWDRGNTTGTCIECSQEFRYYPSEKSGRYCPDCVADPSVSCTPSRADEGETKIVVACGSCHEGLSVYEWRADDQDEIFCDRDCYKDWLSTTQRGEGKWTVEDNPNWNGGVNSDGFYGRGWPSARNQALQRDDRTCQRCNVTREGLGQNPDVHHIRPVRTFDDPRDAHMLENLVCLCRDCHLTVEREDVSIGDR